MCADFRCIRISSSGGIMVSTVLRLQIQWEPEVNRVSSGRDLRCFHHYRPAYSNWPDSLVTVMRWLYVDARYIVRTVQRFGAVVKSHLDPFVPTTWTYKYKIVIEAFKVRNLLVDRGLGAGVKVVLKHVKVNFLVLLTVHLSIFISVINQIDTQNFCFTISLFHASTCFEHMCSKHVEAWNKRFVKQKFCTSSWLITEIKNVKLSQTLYYPTNAQYITRRYN